LPIEGREKGIRSPYEVRFGITHPSYLGVNTQKPALALTDAEGVEGINLRIKGGRPISRGGQAKVNVDTIAPIHGFTDTTSDAGINPNAELNTDIGTPYNAMYVHGNSDEVTGAGFVHVDRASNVVVASSLHDAGRPTAVPIDYNGGDYGAMVFGETDAEVLSLPSKDTLFVLPRLGSIATCYSLLAMDGPDLLAAWVDGGNSSTKVSLWNGSILLQDLLIAAEMRFVTLMKFQGTAYLGIAPDVTPNNNLYKRLPGAGAWTTIAYPSATNFRVHHGTEFAGRLYIIGEDAGAFVIYSTDGNTLVKERTIAVTATSPAVAQFAVVRGSLYYWYHDGTTGGSFSLIGRFDGASWEDGHKNIGAQVSALSYTRGYGFVGGHDGANIVFGDDAGDMHFWESDGINLFGTWTKVLTYAAGMGGDVSLTPPPRAGLVAS